MQVVRVQQNHVADNKEPNIKRRVVMIPFHVMTEPGKALRFQPIGTHLGTPLCVGIGFYCHRRHITPLWFQHLQQDNDAMTWMASLIAETNVLVCIDTKANTIISTNALTMLSMVFT